MSCPHCGTKVEVGLRGCPICMGSLGHPDDGGPPMLAMGTDWKRRLNGCVVLGGYGFPIPLNVPLGITFDAEGVHFAADGPSPIHTIPATTLRSIEVGGPGRTETGGGVIGGGFGLDGIVTGMLIAGVLNALTTGSSILTVVALTTDDGEVWFANTTVEPAALRVELAPAFVMVRRIAAGAQLRS